jgi:hypothetical protein
MMDKNVARDFSEFETLKDIIFFFFFFF